MAETVNVTVAQAMVKFLSARTVFPYIIIAAEDM